jgi:hypothetical protein
MKTFISPRKSVPFCSLALGALLLAPAGAAVVNVDFGQTGQHVYTSTGPAPDSGTTWNEASTGTNVADGLTFSNLLDSTGASTGISVEITSGFYHTYNDNAGNYLEQDWFWVKDGDTGTVTIKGLSSNSNTTYDLYMLIGQDTSSGNDYDTNFTIGNDTKYASGADNAGSGSWVEGKHYVVFTGVHPNTSGEISFTVAGATGTGHDGAGVISGLQIVPEPSGNAALMVLGVVSMFVRRRKRS